MQNAKARVRIWYRYHYHYASRAMAYARQFQCKQTILTVTMRLHLMQI